MKQVNKEYAQPFLLEPTKLSRIVDTIHGSLEGIPVATVHDSFELFLAGSRREEVGTVEAVLAVDNSRKHKIERLVILCSAYTPGTTKPDREIQVDFGGPSSFQSNPGVAAKVVSIRVRGEAGGWSSRALSEIEEQVERTWLHRVRPVGLLIGFLVAVLIALMFQFVSIASPLPYGAWWLNHSDLDRLEVMLKQHAVLTDDDLRDIETL